MLGRITRPEVPPCSHGRGFPWLELNSSAILDLGSVFETSQLNDGSNVPLVGSRRAPRES